MSIDAKFTGATSSSGGAVAFDPTTTYSLFEDFSTGGYNVGGSGQIVSDNAWETVSTGTPVYSLQGATIPSTNAYIGVVEISTSTNAAYGGGITTGTFGGTLTQAFLGGNGQITFDALINVTVSDGSDKAQINAGFRDAPGWNASSNGWHIQYQIEASNFWQLITTAGGVTTTVTSAVTMTTGWHHLKLIMNAAGTSVEGFVDGISLGTSSTNVPTLKVPVLFSIRKTLGTTPRLLGIDYIKIDKTFSTPR